MSSLLLRSGTVLTLNDQMEIVAGDVAIRDGRIEAVGRVDPNARFDRVMDVGGGYVLPGLIQTHIHLCQTLFRGFADDLPLLEWLRRRVWPMEAAHNAESLRAATDLAALELLTSGTTAVLTMETVHETEVVFEAVAASGLRATIGKAMMDAAPEAPARLRETTQTSLDESVSLAQHWTVRPPGGCVPRSRRALPCRARKGCSARSPRCRPNVACSFTRTRPSRATSWRSCASRPAAATLSFSPTSAWPVRVCARRIACGSTSARWPSSPSRASRRFTVPAPT